MKYIRIAGAALNQTPLDWRGNVERIKESIKEAQKQNVSILCLPELCLTGYSCEDAFFSSFVWERAWQELQALLPYTKNIITCIGLPIHHRGVIYNASAMVVDGKIAGLIPKKSLAGDGVHYEQRWFKPWDTGLVDEIKIHDKKYAFGDIYFDCGGVKVGFEICEEAWVAHRPGANLARKGVDVILNPSASHFAFGKINTRKSFVSEGSRSFGVAYVYSNLLGNESGRIIYDGGVLIASEGKIINQGPRFSYRDWAVTTADVDINVSRLNRARASSFEPFIEEANRSCVEVPFNWPHQVQKSKLADPLADWETSSEIKSEEFSRAVTLGLLDFLRKSHQSGFVVSLSGGVDSAACSLLVAMAVELCVQELGLDGFKKKFSYIASLQACKTTKEIVRQILFCVYQGTENSSKETLMAAQTLATGINAEFFNWNVDQFVSGYKKVVSDVLKVELNWQQHDTALQNIQARSRAPGVWLLANLKNALLLTTSNRSESAVGYATMDGDTCGGLSPLGGIDKAFLRRWTVLMETKGLTHLRAYPELKFVNEVQPTAELRPQNLHQTDEKDLMPYDVLDLIEKYAIRDKRSPVEVYELLIASRSESKADLKNWIKKFFVLWCRNQWKRERYAPAFHLDDESLDPKTWCRFPILSSSFEVELEQLDKIST